MLVTFLLLIYCLTPVGSVEVGDGASFNSAITNGAEIEVTSDIILSSKISISSITSLVIHGNGFTLDGDGLSLCLEVISSSDIIIANLTIVNGFSSVI